MKTSLIRFCTLLAASTLAVEIPTGGSVAAGAASLSTSGSVLTVDQSSARAVINWQSFSVGEGASVVFRQPDASSVTLNRVVGGDASRIAGSVTANGSFFLINANGVLFAPGAQVSAASIVASTLAMADSDFMSGRHVLDGAGSGVVINRGNLTAVGDGSGGAVAMVSARVVNEGTIQAHQGQVLLAAADRVTLDLGGLVGITVERGVVDALVDNGGAIRADGGRVLLTARAASELASAAINHDGVIEARTLATGEKGTVLLLADMRSGHIAADGAVDVSAPQGGDGGFVETSASSLSFGERFTVDASAPGGRYGSWLLDPDYIEIVAAGGLTVSAANAQVSGLAQISVTTLSTALNSSDVILEAAQQIDFQVAFNHVANRNSTLSLLAPTIKLGGDITVSGPNRLGLSFGGVSGVTTYAGNLFLYNPGSGVVVTRTLTTNGGNVLFNGNVGGAQNFTVDAGLGEVRFAATMDGSFAVTQQVYGTLAFSYQAGGNVNSICTIDFVNGTVSFDDNGLISQVNQFQEVSGYAFNFPTGYLVIPGGTIMDLNAQRVQVTIYDRFGAAYPNPPTTANNGQMTFASATEVSKFVFEQTNGSWTDILAQGVSWVTTATATKPLDLTVKAAKVTVDSGKTLAVNGDIRISTGNFVNNSGSGALSAGTGKTWQVWSSNPSPFDPTTGDEDGNVPYDYKQYGATYGVTLPAGTGNGLFYSYQPQVSFGLTGSITKVYDGNDSASNLLRANYTVGGGVDGDVIGLAVTMPASGSYADEMAGTSKNVTVTGLNSSHFTAITSTGKPVYGYGIVSSSVVGNIGNITRRTITGITGVTAQDKVYDGLTGATLDTTSPVFAGLVPGDVLTITGATGAFGTADAGSGKTVTVNGLTFGGADLLNYDLPSSFTTTAAITRAPLTVTADDKSKAYDGAVFSGGYTVSYSGFVNGQGAGVLGGALIFGGSARTATAAGSYLIAPTGFTSSNYQINFADGTLTITGSPAPVVDPRDFLPRITPVPTFPTTTPVTLAVSVPQAPAVGPAVSGPAGGQGAAGAPSSPQAGAASGPSGIAVGGLNYVPTSPQQAEQAADSGSGKKTGDTARDKVEGGAVTRSLQAVTDVLVIDGGINLGTRGFIRE